jgi:hypothetical protein
LHRVLESLRQGALLLLQIHLLVATCILCCFILSAADFDIDLPGLPSPLPRLRLPDLLPALSPPIGLPDLIPEFPDLPRLPDIPGFNISLPGRQQVLCFLTCS